MTMPRTPRLRCQSINSMSTSPYEGTMAIGSVDDVNAIERPPRARAADRARTEPARRRRFDQPHRDRAIGTCRPLACPSSSPTGAECTCPASTASTPRPRALSDRATANASRRFCGPSPSGWPGIAHRAGDDDRSTVGRVPGDEVGEVGRLFERVGSVGDDDTRAGRGRVAAATATVLMASRSRLQLGPWNRSMTSTPAHVETVDRVERAGDRPARRQRHRQAASCSRSCRPWRSAACPRHKPSAMRVMRSFSEVGVNRSIVDEGSRVDADEIARPSDGASRSRC